MQKVVLYLFVLCLLIIAYSAKISTTAYKFPVLNHFPTMPLSPSNNVTVEGAKLGRFLFYDPILSGDSDMACSNCHKQEFAFSDSPKPLSTGHLGQLMNRNTMPLFNLAWHPSFFWDGRASSIEAQIFHPINATNEMNCKTETAVTRLNNSVIYRKMFQEAFATEKIDSAKIAMAISQFLRTLISHQSKYDKVTAGEGSFTKEENEGYVLVNDQTKGDCLHCHTTDADALGTTFQFSNNGIDSVFDSNMYIDKGRGGVSGLKHDNGKFKIPSLRNCFVTAPYMHDGRFKTMEEVLNFYSHHVFNSFNVDSKMEFAREGGAKLSDDEKRKIILFLRTLTDSSFIENSEFSNPFITK